MLQSMGSQGVGHDWMTKQQQISFIYLSIIASQCCVRLCCTMKWISCEHTYILSLVDLPCCPSHPSRSSQSQYRVSETLHIISVVCMSCLWVLGVFCCCYCCWKSTVLCFLIPLFYIGRYKCINFATHYLQNVFIISIFPAHIFFLSR